MKCVIAGSRDIDLEDAAKQLRFTITSLQLKITEVVSGTARGADTLGEEWGIANDVEIKRMPADWTKYGKRAGPIRNAEMAEYGDIAIILWNGTSGGSRNMINNMRRLKKPYLVLLVNGTDK